MNQDLAVHQNGVSSPCKFRRIEEKKFHAIDYEVMGVAFSIQNELGRLMNESIYQNEMMDRLKRVFTSVSEEVALTISYRDYTKDYFADVVVEDSVILELKATDSFSASHRLQVLQYLFLSNLGFAKLINFRTPQVTSEFVSTNLDYASRRNLRFDFELQDNSTPESKWFTDLALDLLCHWGGFLGVEIYYAALVHFLGGMDQAVRPIPIQFQGRKLGNQLTHLISDSTAFKISSIHSNQDMYRRELRQFLRRTNLKRIEWLNLDHHDIHFETILH